MAIGPGGGDPGLVPSPVSAGVTALAEHPEGGEGGPRRGRHVRRRERPRPPIWRVSGAVVLACLLAVGALRLATTAPPAVVVHWSLPASVTLPGPAPELAWPSTGEAAMSVAGVGSFGSVGGDQPLPIGSMAKMMTALVVLHDFPLRVGQNGFEYTVTAKDVSDLQSRIDLDQSTVDVVQGEKLSEFQLLQALLIPSGDNIAGILAVKDAGSLDAFVAKMNREARQLGMDHTKYTDASGFLPSTVSTASDQMRLGEVAMNNPVFAQIVGESSATLPVVGVVYNVDMLAGLSGFVGIKTGSDSQAEGCFTFANIQSVSGRRVMLVGAVLHQGEGSADVVSAALQSAQALVQSAVPYLNMYPVLGVDQDVAKAIGADGKATSVKTDAALTTLGWGGLKVAFRISTRRLGDELRAGETIGALDATGSLAPVPAVAGSTLPPPGLAWRLRQVV